MLIPIMFYCIIQVNGVHLKKPMCMPKYALVRIIKKHPSLKIKLRTVKLEILSI